MEVQKRELRNNCSQQNSKEKVNSRKGEEDCKNKNWTSSENEEMFYVALSLEEISI